MVGMARFVRGKEEGEKASDERWDDELQIVKVWLGK